MDQEDPPPPNSDSALKARERAARAEGDVQVGAVAVAQAAPGGRRSGPRIRRTASQRRRARERAGLEPASEEQSSQRPDTTQNEEELIAADAEFDEMILEEENEEVLGFWQLDRTDRFICGGIAVLVVALIIILGLGLS